MSFPLWIHQSDASKKEAVNKYENELNNKNPRNKNGDFHNAAVIILLTTDFLVIFSSTVDKAETRNRTNYNYTYNNNQTLSH